jgi:heme-degrading monooxygenase HmoA
MIVTVTVLQYQPSARLRAFGNMGRVLMQPVTAPGLRFAKLLGSGIDFGMVPDLSRYVFLGVWDHESAARAFFQTPDFGQFTNGTDHTETLWLRPLQAHGLWDGGNPFSTNSEQRTANSFQPTANNEQPTVIADPRITDDKREPLLAVGCSLIAVLTRATIRPRALLDFWRHVPQTRDRLRQHADELLFGIGVGELPLIQQCTISVWRNADAVNQYAYRDSGHREVVKLTRQRKWYSEELFARFAVVRWEKS